ncbi:triose-phosphate isomerase [Patescibacteria group bacterium]|nr:triose-phosphate isomerase [Patescibacteria group bacterium]
MIFINFKTYQEASGLKALSLVSIIEDVAISSQIKIIPVVQIIDLKEIVSVTKLEVWVQKIDSVSYGANTGSILAEEIVNAGARGTFLNHSENKISDFNLLKTVVDKAKKVNLKTLVFCSSLEELEKNKTLNPDFLSYEPPELIGGDISVAASQPDIIAKAAVISKEAGIPLIIGAGIASQEDVRKSLEMGAVGVAVASHVIKSQNPRGALMNLTEGFN